MTTAERRTAVAIQYQHPGVPRVTAKGQGSVAEQIIATAQAAGVMVEENAALAEALSKVELDDEIPEPLYKAVAQVIVFVLRATGQVPTENPATGPNASKPNVPVPNASPRGGERRR